MPRLALKDKECFELWCGMLQIVLSHHFQKPEIINSMMMIVFSHRYNKGDKFIQEAE